MQGPYARCITYMVAPWCCQNPLPPLCLAGLLAPVFIMNLNMTVFYAIQSDGLNDLSL